MNGRARCVAGRSSAVLLLGRPADIHHVVATDEYFAQLTRELPVHILFRFIELNVHVAVHAHQLSLVREAPLQLHEHGLAGQPVEEGLRVDDRRHPDAPIDLLDDWLRSARV